MKAGALLVYILLSILHSGYGQQPKLRDLCKKRSCYPATGNLLIGREDKLSANATCGTESKSRYCIISSLDIRSNQAATKCHYCDATDDELAHNVTSIVHKMEPADEPRDKQKLTWWQAPNGQAGVTITLNLEAEFHVTHVIITFKTFRPAAMFIEKSFDWGQNWKKHRYFSADCDNDFPGIHQGVPRTLNESVCQKRYSRIAPSTNGEIIYRVLPPNIKLNSPNFDPYSREVQELLKTTNLRLTFTRFFTLGDDNLLDNKEEVMEKYYYAISSMVVRGSCSCYGHASTCMPEKEEHKTILGMVHGTCNCEHNTMGKNCEHCKPFFQDWPWRPGFGKKRNECKECNCNNHTDKCHFDPRMFEATGNTTGGVCDGCQHNTEGRQCDLCMESFYKDPQKDMTDPDVCLPCNCDTNGTLYGFNSCTSEPAGQCECKLNVGGLQCNHCAAGYWNFTTENPDGCQQCTCNPHGTVNSADGGCDERTGACTCKRNVANTRDCDQCKPEHYGLSEDDPLGCKACDCDPGGAYNNNCDVNTGQCMCRPNIKGARCDTVEDFYYTGPLDYLLFEGELASGTDKPPTSVIRKKPSNLAGQDTWTGFGYMQVFEGATLTFHVPDIYRTMDYFPIIRYQHEPSHPTDWDQVTIELERMDGPPDPNGPCSDAIDTMDVSLSASQLHTEPQLPFCLESGQRYNVKVTFTQWSPSTPTQGANIFIDSIVLLPDVDDIPFLNVAVTAPTMLPPIATLAPLPIDAEDGNCPEDYFLCGNNQTCILTNQMCDGTPNCPDGEEDEQDCSDDDGVEVTTQSWINLGILTPGGQPTEPPMAEPDVSTKGWYPGDEAAEKYRNDFDTLECRKHFFHPFPGRMPDSVPAECMPILRSISFLTFQGAHLRNCDCDGTGSNEYMCDKYYGGCDCKSLVVGRRCDSCAPASYGFSSSGCNRCECHHAGSKDEFCDQDSGQCECNTDQPTFGRKCDECKPGYWNFPDCRQCECNGHADTCQPTTGKCNDCRDATMGDFCDKCVVGYYGRPELGANQVQCRECKCPDTKASGHSFAWENTCELDATTDQVACHCEDGYTGDKCDVCDDNFFGHPEMPGGSCERCDCNQNWIESEEGNCDPHTGQCMKCVYYTEGWNCEHCMAGWWGDAVNNQCNECTCDQLGTDPERSACDRSSGVCNCLPNVTGEHCERCIENHWKIASGEGCEACDCDPIGSEERAHGACDTYFGQCECKVGYGGRRCNECEENMWGDPQVECKPCSCNERGVDPNHPQCDSVTGQCTCLEGIGGEKCDECAVGFVHKMPLTSDHPVNTRIIPSGQTPNCQPCGECFDNWNRILNELQDNTTERVRQAEMVKVTGAAGAYTAAFENMETKIEEVNDIIGRSSLKNEALDKFTSSISSIEDELEATTSRSKLLDNSLAETEQSIHQGNYNLTQLRGDADKLQRQAENIKDQATQLQEANVAGALKLTKDALDKSEAAQRQVDAITGDGGLLKISEKNRLATEQRIAIDSQQQGIADTTDSNNNELMEVTDNIAQLERRIPDLNKAVCDGETTVEKPCDDLCGGAGCGKCGDVSCSEGALTKAQDAVTDAKEALKILEEKNLQAEKALNSINAIHSKVKDSSQLAQAAYDMANDAKTRSKSESDSVDELMQKIENFLSAEHATPEQVKEVAQQCLDSEMTMDAEQIKTLADQINAATDSVKNVDKINQETAQPLAQAESLKMRADEARELAAAQLTRAEKVTKSLGDAEDAQSAAEAAIATAQRDIQDARADLGYIESEMQDATQISEETFTGTKELIEKQKALQTAYISNENHVKKAQTAADGAKTLASKANSDLYALNSKFRTVSDSLAQKENKIGSAKDRALSLQRRANTLSNSASQKLADLNDMEKQYEDNQKELETLSSTLTEMNCQMQIHLKVIQSKSAWYASCTAPDTWRKDEDCSCPSGQTEPECTASIV